MVLRMSETNPYNYPQIYVEEDKDKIDPGSKVIFEKNDGAFCLAKYDREEVFKGNVVKRLFASKPYETAYEEIVDLEKAGITKSFIVYAPKRKTYILVEKGSNVQLLDIVGLKIFLAIEEGDRVKEGDIIGYQVTGKLEVRNIISNGEGVVAYIGTVFEETQHYIVVLVGEENVREINVTEC